MWNTSMKSSSYFLSALLGTHTSVRMFVGAIHAFFFLQRGLSLQDIAILQIIHSTTVFVMEIPTGVFSDILSRKMSVIASCILLSVFYPICLMAPKMEWLIAGQIIYALGLCLISGAGEAWLVDAVSHEYPTEPKKINYFGHLEGEFAGFGSMIMGPLGAIICCTHPDGFAFVYWGSTLLMLFTAFCFYRLNNFSVNQKKNISLNLFQSFIKMSKESLLALLKRDGKIYFIIGSLIVVAYQPLYHYWQPVLMKLGSVNFKESFSEFADPKLLGFAFFMIGLAKYLGNKFVKTSFFIHSNPFSISISAAILSSIFFISFSVFKINFIYFWIVLLCLLHGALSVLTISVDNQYFKVAPKENLAGILSLKSSFERIMVVGALFIISITIDANTLIYLFSAGALPLLAGIFYISYWKKNYVEPLKSGYPNA